MLFKVMMTTFIILSLGDCEILKTFTVEVILG